MKIYLARNKVQAGPYTLDQLNTMLVSGEVSLDDLLWHAPMKAWQRVGDVTANQYRYQPTGSMTPPAPSQQSAEPARQPVRGFGDNPDFKPDNADKAAPSSEPRRVSVADLYGKKSAESPQQMQPNAEPSYQAQVQTGTIYASISSRFLAVMLNFVLFLLALLPFFQAFMRLHPDPELINAGEFAERMVYAEQLAAQIPMQVAGLTTALVIGYLLIQLLLITMRGQSFGKLVVGIRTVDVQTHEMPGFFRRVILRAVLPIVVYFFAAGVPLFLNLAVILLAVNYFLVARNSKRQGWHDKLAGTVVVKSSIVPHKK